MPIANGFLTEDEFSNEYFFTLKVGVCDSCHMVQLVSQPEREMMFHQDYAFFSSTSERQKQHFARFADKLISDYCQSNDPFIVEIGSNDGIMLRNLSTKNIRHLGIEPSSNVAEVAIENGVNTISEFFDAALAQKIVADYGHADAVTSANVICHIPYIHSIVSGIKTLLRPDGLFIFEDPYLGDIIEKVSYDQIYDEHVFYFSVSSVSRLLEQHDMEIVDVEHLDVHGGSMRYYIANKGKHPISDAVIRQYDKEVSLGIQDAATYATLRENIEKSREKLLAVLTDLHDRGERIVGYGATSKSTTVTNYCGIGPELIDYISDTTPLKQGKYSPGAHIPVLPYETFGKDYPRYTLLFAWNHAGEIMAKEDAYKRNGGKWVVYVPKVGIIDDSL
jgi:methylation protein EvaC